MRRLNFVPASLGHVFTLTMAAARHPLLFFYFVGNYVMSLKLHWNSLSFSFFFHSISLYYSHLGRIVNFTPMVLACLVMRNIDEKKIFFLPLYIPHLSLFWYNYYCTRRKNFLSSVYYATHTLPLVKQQTHSCDLTNLFGWFLTLIFFSSLSYQHENLSTLKLLCMRISIKSVD